MEKGINIIRKIEECLPSMTASQLKIANYILSDPMVLLFSSIEQASKQIGVSTATIVRFANLFGFHGYTELQGNVRAHYQQQVDPEKRLNANLDESSSSDNIFHSTYMQQLKPLESLYTDELEEKLKQTVDLLSAANHIYTSGPRGSFAIAYYLGHHLNRIFHNCDILEDNERISDLLARIKPGDVMLIINQPRYARRMYQSAQIAKNAGAKLIVITDNIMSPYCKISDVFFIVPNQSGDFHNSLLATLMIAEILITSMMVRNKKETQEGLVRMEPLFKQLNTFL